jgi:hypothetical protein
MVFQAVMVATVNMVLPAVMLVVAVVTAVLVLAVDASYSWQMFGGQAQTLLVPMLILERAVPAGKVGTAAVLMDWSFLVVCPTPMASTHPMSVQGQVAEVLPATMVQMGKFMSLGLGIQRPHFHTCQIRSMRLIFTVAKTVL